MKKEYKAPVLSIVNVEIERPMMSESQGEWVESKKNSHGFVDDEEETPAAPKKFWDDEE
ncbi:MAG: hypothetical protein IK124_06235 [Prevotella sp.]|nr:hypothetical protein [Prevotella sp.]